MDGMGRPVAVRRSPKLHIRRHGENASRPHKALSATSEVVDCRTLYDWINGVLAPRSLKGLRVLGAIEHRCRLPEGYFRAKLPHPGRLIKAKAMQGLSVSGRRRLAWHPPDNFDQRRR
ncbi:hypothetical protein EIB18_14520 [Caulobacter vibrioides]|uniref:Uncharacterized protein n=2 Tax=Caulobacter vibrioides TaxID=155892 RepID=Q9A4T9_CAUVC|nr:hypothetical protein [Caulobacter vibrioides]YP_002518197.1 hypothetical protein CCNA_02824 [Caulobacter vibrioides NA1000]AAK24703.1 hypothetical protein CC_2738 [Caulobacter vibrioides CB15]ACL96289.1 hypothetical protein CCNA_02824 [Caulobacter vibrioides NA1000]ATC29575.1 hypothetical protein CA607_14785 [Caulobacter vibrioides]AZH13807.1 hypothetical protein EIB18_14520 [Caulobacter vibrioides]QXZ51094.1 hypothetical protein KZH45_14545 [Caulobacter vibrioides]